MRSILLRLFPSLYAYGTFYKEHKDEWKRVRPSQPYKAMMIWYGMMALAGLAFIMTLAWTSGVWKGIFAIVWAFYILISMMWATDAQAVLADAYNIFQRSKGFTLLTEKERQRIFGLEDST